MAVADSDTMARGREVMVTVPIEVFTLTGKWLTSVVAAPLALAPDQTSPGISSTKALSPVRINFMTILRCLDGGQKARYHFDSWNEPSFLRGSITSMRRRRPDSSPRGGFTVAGQYRDFTGIRCNYITTVLPEVLRAYTGLTDTTK